MSFAKLAAVAFVAALLAVLALVASGGIPGQTQNDQVCTYGATYTSICNSMTTICTSFGGTCQTCDTSNPVSGKRYTCQTLEESSCFQFTSPGLVNCGPRTVGVCIDDGGGGYECSNTTSSGSCLTAGDTCSL